MTEIKIYERAGTFAEDKDVAREIRINEIMPLLGAKRKVILDFQNVDAATQSFVHALISEAIRKNGLQVLDQLRFKNCNQTVKKIINIVVDYMQDVE
ncbi:MAG: STAS-like domain-containing protein [Candidatus Diapherotrites archaeon]|nr:STAS-like domain-containing protein [Candidatus Diapherotrites archaeon]